MKRIPRILVVFCVMVLAAMACNLPGNQATQEFPPTPNATMTALYAMATILTPSGSQEGSASSTPEVNQQNTATFTQQPDEEEEQATQAPSKTFTPQANPTRATPQRGGTQIKAEYMSDSLDIDGDWADWDTTQYGANTVVYGLNQWVDGNDLEASYRVSWDEDYLYLAVKVRDDKYVQRATGADLYKGDSIELLLDTNFYGDFGSTTLSPDDFQLGISPGYETVDQDTEAYLWFPTERTGNKNGVIIGASGGNDLYRVEFAVPWSVFGVTPAVGQHYGFALSVSDNDNGSSNVQQSMVSSAARRSLVDPTSWGELVLTN